MLLRTFVLCIVLVDMRTCSSPINHLNFDLSLSQSLSEGDLFYNGADKTLLDIALSSFGNYTN